MSALETTRESPEFSQLRGHLLDRHWRLNNLYRIRDENGAEVPYRMNPAQAEFDRDCWFRNAIPKARRLGFSTHIGICMLDRMLFNPNTLCGIIDLTLDDAEKKMRTMQFAYRNLPTAIRYAMPLAKPTNQSEMTLANGSAVSVGTSHRGGNLHWLHVSEYGKISVQSPDLAREIRNGAFPSVPQGFRIDCESTAHGTSGEFADMCGKARKSRDEGRKLTALDFRLHFAGWWMKPEYRLEPTATVITPELLEYFAGVEAAIARALDPRQRSWYAFQLGTYGPDDMREEYPSTVDELFFNSMKGAYFRDEISTARREGRIGQPLPHDPTRVVNTFWDIGEDGTAIWFHQTDGYRHRFIDYWELIGSGNLQAAARVLDEKRDKRGFRYGKHLGPHDLNNRDWAHHSNTRKQTALDLGILFTVVPKVQYKDDSIAAARRMLGMSAFDAVHCKVGVEHIENYRRQWNKTLGVFMADPVHNEDSHGADALQQGAMGFMPERESTRHRRRDRPEGVTQWGA